MESAVAQNLVRGTEEGFAEKQLTPGRTRPRPEEGRTGFAGPGSEQHAQRRARTRRARGAAREPQCAPAGPAGLAARSGEVRGAGV